MQAGRMRGSWLRACRVLLRLSTRAGPADHWCRPTHKSAAVQSRTFPKQNLNPAPAKNRRRPLGQSERMTAIDTARGHNPAYVSLSVPAAIVGLALLAAMLHVVTPFNHDEAYFIAAAR